MAWQRALHPFQRGRHSGTNTLHMGGRYDLHLLLPGDFSLNTVRPSPPRAVVNVKKYIRYIRFA